MDSTLYVAANGAMRAMQLQQINANNLANVNTPGFQADLQTAQSIAVIGDTLPSQVYSQNASTIPNFSPGSMMTTGRDLDIAVQGDGYIAVQSADGGELIPVQAI